MAKGMKPVAPVRAPGVSVAAGADEILANMEAGKRPYTVLAGRHQCSEMGLDGNTQNTRVVEKGETFYDTRDWATMFPEKFVAGTGLINNGNRVQTPGLGTRVTENLNAGAYEVYIKDGVCWAYVGGDYSAPASPALLDLVAAEEWIADNPL